MKNIIIYYMEKLSSPQINWKTLKSNKIKSIHAERQMLIIFLLNNIIFGNKLISQNY
jgi:hypothetical protein